jgi:hypothetical protein
MMANVNLNMVTLLLFFVFWQRVLIGIGSRRGDDHAQTPQPWRIVRPA